MKTKLFGILLLSCCQCFANEPDERIVAGEWSPENNGLRGRILLAEAGANQKGMRTGIVYLELQNVARGGTIYIDYDAKKLPFQPALNSSEGKEIKNWISTSSFVPEPCRLAMPNDSTLRFPMRSSAIDPDEPGCYIIAGFLGGKWFLPDSLEDDCYLSARFTVTIPPDESSPRMWEGTLTLPPIKIPRDKP